MKYLIICILCFCWGIAVNGFAQEGRPALEVETSEDLRVKTVIQKAFPHDLENWEIDDESRVDGIQWFHNSGTGYNSPFDHSFSIRYKRKNISNEEREKWLKGAVNEAGIQKMLDETECEFKVEVNTFYHEFSSKNIPDNKSIAPFSLVFVGQHGAELCMGSAWRIDKTELLDDGRHNFVITHQLNKTVPMTQIQSILISVQGSPSVLDFFLKRIDLKSLQALIGQNRINHPSVSQATPLEKPLGKPIAGNNEIEFSLDGGDFQNREFKLKPSKVSQFGYLRNNHPNIAVTENAVTRILIQEDDDFKTYNKTGFLDITIPFIRNTGQFDVTPSTEKATFSGGINCWDGCEYSFDAEEMNINITRYDAVGGFIEGTFSGEVKVGYKINQPIDNEQHKKPNAIIKGRFKVRRNDDRY